jgi:hypothetical protein
VSENTQDQEHRMTDETKPQDGKAMSPASAGSHVLAWAVVNPSGGTRHLSLTNEDAQRVATASERVVPVSWPTLTDEERFVLLEVRDIYADEDDVKCNEIAAVIDRLLERTK